jgi:peptidoglycan/xylan/chitin deacetylase (PgdA/CDA1 family)
LLITLDDGLASNYEAAVWLAQVGIQAAFFIIPSLVDRTVAQFVRYHRERGVEPFPPTSDGAALGLSTSQVREMLSMGHRVGAHNYAHRDLGLLHEPADMQYEIDQAIESVSELTGAACRDFAIGFGQPQNVSEEAASYLKQACPNVYMCYRGLNVPARTPRFFLRHAHEPHHPKAFARICLEGGADHRFLGRNDNMKSRVGLLPRRRDLDA